MTTYLLDIKQETKYQYNTFNLIYHFQIDINGNVCIKKGDREYNYREYNYRDCDCIIINDNIPFPSYLIKSIELLIMGVTLSNENTHKRSVSSKAAYGGSPTTNCFYDKHFELIADTIIRIKTSLKEIIENPKEHLDLEQQLNSYIAKSKLQQEYILEVEKKMENLQTAYFDVLNDNKKFKEINNVLRTKNIELERKLNEEVSKASNKTQLDEHYKLEQKRLEELEKERIWYEYKQSKNNFTFLNH